MTRHPLDRPTQQRGATLMEFVIVLPVAMLFVLGLIQTGFIYMAKLHLNHATFMAARVGSQHNANEATMRNALLRGLSPFYQNSFETNDNLRLASAWLATQADNTPVQPWRVKLERLSPSANSFKDFGVKDPKTGVSYIPNDNLEWRSQQVGATSQQNLRDANLLKLRVVYGYELKVPLMAGIVRRIMCSGQAGPEAWGNVAVWESVYTPANENCLRYYLWDRIPIETTAIVEMQSRAQQ